MCKKIYVDFHRDESYPIQMLCTALMLFPTITSNNIPLASIMATEPNPTSLQASLILPQDFSIYVKWQLKRTPGSDIGLIRNAIEYFRFVQYRDALIDRGPQSSASSILLSPPSLPSDHNSRTGSECGHTIHPSNPLLVELCPVCEVRAHLSFLLAITMAWDKAGRPRIRLEPHIWGGSYGEIRTSWHTARLQFQQFQCMLEVLLEYEEAWELKHPLQVETAQRTNSASAALKLAREQSRYPALLDQAFLQSKKAKVSLTVKQVTFAPEVQIKHNGHSTTSALEVAHGRPLAKFNRLSQKYEPGRYACHQDTDFIDTAGTRSEFSDVKNLKIFVTDDENAFESLQENHYLFKNSVGEYQGLVGMHALEQEVFDFLGGYIEDDPQARDYLGHLLHEADRLTVLIDEDTGGVVDAFLFDGSDDEDEEDHQRLEKADKDMVNQDWTCLKECLSVPLPVG